MLPEVDETLLTFPERATFHALVRREGGRNVASMDPFYRLNWVGKAKVVWPAWLTGLAVGVGVTTIVFLSFPILELPEVGSRIFFLTVCMCFGILPGQIHQSRLVQRFIEKPVLEWLSTIDFQAREKKREEERNRPYDDFDYESYRRTRYRPARDPYDI